MIKLTTGSCIWLDMSQAASSEVRDKFESFAQIAKLEAVYDEAVALKRSA
jgi:hypothetical protein